MKFDFVIGNPPYQDNTIGENDTYAPPIYNTFMDASYSVADKVELIHPARFLFNAGSTPKSWNQQMLNDEHFKVLFYEENSSKVFANTDIKGGVVISYRDKTQNYGAIEIFTPYEQLNKILNKVKDYKGFQSFSDIVVTSYAYHFLEKMYQDFPDCITSLSAGHEYDLKSNVFEKMPEVFSEKRPNHSDDYIRILGRKDNERCYKYIRSEYINAVCNINTYKVFMSGATGTGKMGETIAEPIIGYPHDGSTETFLSIGVLNSENEAKSVIKYIKTKFARALFSILKKTQANTPGKWKYVPLQDFTTNSDIDWSVSVKEIDKQLYKKYGLSEEEITFIETKVKEME